MIKNGFNPCFNGYSTLTHKKDGERYFCSGFNPCFNGYSTLTNDEIIQIKELSSCFNPCFNGYSTLTTGGVTV